MVFDNLNAEGKARGDDQRINRRGKEPVKTVYDVAKGTATKGPFALGDYANYAMKRTRDDVYFVLDLMGGSKYDSNVPKASQ